MREERTKLTVIACALGVMVASGVEAAPLLLSASGGSRSASALFETSGTNLVITLTNTASGDAMVPVDVMTGLFFEIAGPTLALGRTSAVVPAGHQVFNGPTDPGGVIGGEWAFVGGLVGAPFGA